MRPASTRVVTVWITVLCLLTALCSLNPLASAEAAKGSKRKLAKQHAPAIGSVAVARAKKPGAPPPVTTDTWQGGASGNWSNAVNWNNGAIGSGYDIVIGTPNNAATTDDVSYTVGTLTLSNSGNSVALNNNVQTTVTGNISNAGTITFNAAGNVTGLFINNALTLSGNGNIDLTSTNGQYTGYLYGTTGAILTTSSNIVGAGTVGNGQLNFVNSGTINGNIIGQTLTVNPDGCVTCTNTNTGTLEATGGGTLTLSGGTWTQTGAGKISAAAGSSVSLTNNVSITGGTLSTTGSGVISNAASTDVFLTNVTNTGNYTVQNNAATEINGTLTNNGTITLAAAGNVTELYLTGNTTLSGTGTVVLSTTNNQWTGYFSGVSGSVLTNQTNITGWGTVGNGVLQIANASNGLINSNIAGGNILLNPLASVTSTNAGLVEATNGGTLTLSAGTWTNTGTIEAAANSSVALNNNVSITGGTLESIGSGVVYNQASTDVFLTSLTLAGTYDVQNNAATEINGTITNNGVINLQSSGNLTELYVTSAGSGTATLNGSGSVVLGTGTNNAFNGAGGTSLIIDQNVSGVGNIGEGALTLTNNSTINANISPTVSTQPLTIQPGAGGMANNSILEATNGGNLTLTGSTFTNSTNGVIEAVGTDGSSNPSTVVLANGVTVSGGTLTTSGGGIIEVAGSNIANLTNLTNSGTLNVINNGEIDATGTITNNGTITLQASGNATYYYAGAATTLTGTGTLVMGSTNGQYTANVDTAGGLTNDETITGAGTLGNGTFVNNGTVNANVSGQVLLLTGLTTPTNTKTLEATGGGTLELSGSSWNNAGGTITAQASSAVDLTGNVTITGGTLTTSGAGSQIYVAASNTVNLTGLTNSGTLNVQNNGQIDATGTITNNGTITLQASGNATYYYAAAATTLTGTGTLVMSSTNGQYTGNLDGAGGFTNDETITGAGQIDSGAFVNNGTINANVNGQTLTLQSFSAATNTKTMEASGGGAMLFNGSSWTNTGGIIEAQAGSSVNLEGNVTIMGGTLTTSGSGAINVLASNDAFLSGLTNSGTLNAQNNSQLQLTGAITNTGTISLQASGNQTYLLINGAVTLSGSGTIDLTSTNGQYTNSIYGVGAAPILTSFNTIEGVGSIGSNNMGFTNNGTVDANVAGQNLNIQVDSSGFTNWNGTTHTLTGGTYIANGGNITFASGGAVGITTLSANVTEENGGQILDTSNSNANALAGLTSITSTGALTTDVNFVDGGSFSNAGSLTILNGTSFKVGSLTQVSAGSLTAGTYVLDANLALTGATQTITTNAANLTLAGGTIENANSTNALAGLSTNTGKLTIGGASNNVSTTASSFSNTGTLTINGGDSFTAGNLAQISGSTLSGGTFILGGNLDLTTTGINITTNATTLTLQGGTIMSGSANALAALATNSGKLTIGGTSNAVSTSVSSFSNTGTLTINATDSFNATTLTQLTGPNNNKTLASGTYVLAGNLDLSTSGISITKNNANLTLEGGTINSNFANALGGLATNAGHLTIAGTGVNVSTTAASFSNTGTLTIDSGDSFSAPALTQISGSTISGGAFILAGNLDLTAAANITTNSSALTLEGGTIKTGSTNDLANLSSNTDSLTLASNASFTTTGNFTNTGALTINKGSTFTLTGTNVLTNLSSGTLSGGTYTIGGTLQLTTTNGSIKTNAANLTLTGAAAKIHDGSANALATFNNNTGTFALANGATLTTAASSDFSNSGTVTVNKGTTMTVGGSHNYNQTAGTTTVDGTLNGTNITATGGTVQGAGTLVGNTSVGNATGAGVTLNVGDSGKTGLLAITGGYTQLATGNMTGLINGTTAGTGFSQINVTGTAALGGTINFTVAAAFQSSLFLGETFTVLNAGAVTGNFTNSTIAINSNFHFAVSYTGTSVVLTVASGPVGAPNSSSAQPAAALLATARPATATSAKSRTGVVISGLGRVSGAVRSAKPVMVAGLAQPAGRSNAISGRESEFTNLRPWQQTSIISAPARQVAVAQPWRTGNETASHVNAPASDLRMGQSHVTPVQPVAGWMNGNRRTPVEVMKPLFPRIAR